MTLTFDFMTLNWGSRKTRKSTRPLRKTLQCVLRRLYVAT